MKIEKLIYDRRLKFEELSYEKHPYSMRCSLINDNDNRLYLKNAFKRGKEICSLLCPEGADAFLFHYNAPDVFNEFSEIEIAEYKDKYISKIAKDAEMNVTTLYSLIKNFNGELIRNLEVKDNDSYMLRRHRIICHPNEKKDTEKVISALIGDNYPNCFSDIGLVSFENECLITFDGYVSCGIIFFDEFCYQENYEKLSKFLSEN